MVFSLCFDSKFVSGTQEYGWIEFMRDDDIFTCEYNNVLPSFCGGSIETDHEMNLDELKSLS